MTEKLAREIFNVLIETIQLNSFQGVGTFMIEEIAQKKEIYEEEGIDYQYIDTNLIIQQYIDISKSPQGAKYALQKLTKAISVYFTLSNSLTPKFGSSLKELGFNKPIPEMILNLSTERTINLNEIFHSQEVKEIINLIAFLDKNSELDDALFIETLKNI